MSRLAIPFPRRPLAVLLLSLAAATAYAAPVAVDLPAQALGESIKKLADLSGISIAVDASLVSGKTAPAVKGKLEPADALRKLLEGSGLSVSFEGNKAVIGKSATVLKEVAVVSDSVAVPKEGSAEVGYKPTTTNTAGPWGGRKILDTPYSIFVASQEVIENLQASSPEQVFKINPLVQAGAQGMRNDTPSITFRGFSSNSTLLDGLPGGRIGVDVEELDKIEIFNGLSGFLYGTGNVGGLVNYTLKRPTETNLISASVGNYGGSQYYGHIDAGGRFGNDGIFGYRVNAVSSDGETAVKGQHVNRKLLSMAFDWRITDKWLAQIDMSHREYEQKGTSVNWILGAGVTNYPSVAADKLQSPGWTYRNTDTDRVGVGLTGSVNESIAIRAKYSHQEDTSSQLFTNQTILANGTYTLRALRQGPATVKNDGYSAFADIKFDTFGVQHKSVFGFSGYEWRQGWSGFKIGTITGLSEINESTQMPVIPSQNSSYLATKWVMNNWHIGDEIIFNDQWSVLVGGTLAELDAKSYSPTGVTVGTYKKSALTPSLAVIYKPINNISIYGQYIESLEQGVVVDSTYKNAGSILEPLVSKQVEVGVKYAVSDILLTGALYQIKKSNQYSDDGTETGTYVQDGLQVHNGLEFTASGKLTNRLSVVGGFTLMDLKVKESDDPSIEGKAPIFVPRKIFKLYSEYAVPGLQGLSVSAGFQWVGSRYYDTNNTIEIPSYHTYDLGVRYQTKVSGTTVSAKLNIVNLENKNYIGGGGWPNAEPRMILFSVKADF
jgi:iron complex outermembrane recepter protein